MNYNKKIPAFTLSEILVVLAITAIVIGIAFSVLTLVTKQYNAMRDGYAFRSEVVKLKQRLSLDFNTASSANWNPKDEQLILFHREENIIYSWSPEYVIRNTDTLNLPIIEAIPMRQGLEVEKGVIDGLKLRASQGREDTHIFISREVDALTNLNAIWE